MEQDLEDVYESIREDDHWDHLREPGIVLVKGVGQTVNPTAMVVLGAPGATENTKRRPACGYIGRLLNQLMSSAGLNADEKLYGDILLGTTLNAFVTCAIKYRLPGNRVPNTREILFGAESLRREWMAIGRPKLIVAVGSVARAALAPVEQAIAPGDWLALPDGQTFLWVQYHPTYGIQHPEARDKMERHWEAMGKWIRTNGMA